MPDSADRGLTRLDDPVGAPTPDEMIDDGMGEFINILSGNALALLESRGIDAELEPPQAGVMPTGGSRFDPSIGRDLAYRLGDASWPAATLLEGTPLPDLTLVDLEGRERSLDEFRGKLSQQQCDDPEAYERVQFVLQTANRPLS